MDTDYVPGTVPGWIRDIVPYLDNFTVGWGETDNKYDNKYITLNDLVMFPHPPEKGPGGSLGFLLSIWDEIRAAGLKT